MNILKHSFLSKHETLIAHHILQKLVLLSSFADESRLVKNSYRQINYLVTFMHHLIYKERGHTLGVQAVVDDLSPREVPLNLIIIEQRPRCPTQYEYQIVLAHETHERVKRVGLVARRREVYIRH